MHAPELHAEVARLAAAGQPDAAIARALGLPRTTVRDIRVASTCDRERCPRCWRHARAMRFTAGEYAELLGLYLGDGHISTLGRTQRLRISLDSGHAQIVADARALLEACFPGNRVGCIAADGGATSVLNVYSSHMACLFPQHGPGAKHDRPIVLEAWQLALVDAAPFAFLRGLIHSDGCFFINRTGRHRYLSVAFSNRSDDIKGLFCRTAARVGVECRPGRRDVRVYRRASVELLTLFVGAKW